MEILFAQALKALFVGIVIAFCGLLFGCAYASPGGHTLVLAPRSTHALYVQGGAMDAYTNKERARLAALAGAVR